MACSKMMYSQLFKVTDIISAQNSFRFCIEYLNIHPSEYRNIEHDNQFKHHETLFQCLETWVKRVEKDNQDPRNELTELMTRVQEEKSWFLRQDMAFLLNVNKEVLSDRKFFLSIWCKNKILPLSSADMANWLQHAKVIVFLLQKWSNHFTLFIGALRKVRRGGGEEKKDNQQRPKKAMAIAIGLTFTNHVKGKHWCELSRIKPVQSAAFYFSPSGFVSFFFFFLFQYTNT